jgi:hypothetical protein
MLHGTTWEGHAVKKFFAFLFVISLGYSSSLTSDTLADSITSFTANEPLSAESLAEAAWAAESTAQWRRFSVNLVSALKSSHTGVQVAAMQYVIRYAEQIDVSEAAFDVMRIYRNDPDSNRRRMAVVALGSMKNKWALRFLERSVPFEKSEKVSNTILAVLAQENS